MATLTDKIRFIESVFGAGRLARNGKNFDVRCPICDPCDQSKKKLAIKVDDDRCHCWTCGYKAGSLAPLIFKHGTREQFVEYRDKFMSAAQKGRMKVGGALELERRVELPKGFRMFSSLNQSEARDPDVVAMRRYLFNKRKVTERDLWYFRLGFTDDDLRWRRRIIIPSFDSSGQLNYFVGRAIDEQRKPKYDNPDVDKLPIIFNEMNVDWNQRLLLCEGAFDLMKCPDNSVPLLGSDLNEESALFNAILVNSTPVNLALDADMWFTKTQRLAKKLSEYNIDVRVVDVREFGDPGKAPTKKRMKEAVDAAKPYEWTDSFLTRLERAASTSLGFRRSAYG